MSEQIATAVSSVGQETTQEAQLIKLEPLSDVIERLKQTVEFVPAADLPDDAPKTGFMISEYEQGDSFWNRVYSESVSPGSTEIIPSQDEESATLFDETVARARKDQMLFKGVAAQEGRWWLGSPTAEPRVEAGINEIYSITEGDRQVDLLNCTEREMTEIETASIERVISAVSTLTGGKIFDRIKGIMLVPDEDLGHKSVSYSSEPLRIMGDFNYGTGIVRINLDYASSTELQERVQKYFEPGSLSALEFILAHELGHAMDVRTIEEVDAHGISKEDREWSSIGDVTKDFSSFQQLAGWVVTKKLVDGATDKKEEVWTYDDTRSTECVPTNYGSTDPKEDFAESFAIVTLGGDISDLPDRYKQIAKTIHTLEGTQEIGPKLAKVEKVDPENFLKNRITKVGLNVYKRRVKGGLNFV